MTDRSHVVLTGATGSLGRRVLELLSADPAVAEIVAVDAATPLDLPPRATFAAADLSQGELKPLLEGADTVVHLAFAAGQAVADEATISANIEGTRRLLDSAGAVGVRHVVLMSSAAVYGAWPNNPVPLTEDAPVRPNPGAAYAVQKGEIERLGRSWAAAHPGTTVAVLRPAVAVAGGEWSWLARSLGLSAGIRAGHDDPPFQLLHLDDLAAAVDVARRAGLDGPYNVAPDGWVSGEEAHALAGDPPRVRLPAWAVTAAAAVLWRWRMGRMPPGLVPYTMHPWVVANDRLKAAGWAPTRSNEETWVEATPGTPWSRLSPKQRQELALGAAGAGGLGALAGLVAAARRARSSRRAG
ncbi:MAG: NAD-dependent epimerase/dehydratase family protein [Acidobacteria bacterium]|nr:NAD-dependent epimerase/dehydratase family protein [Acidobacteriota bacterium]